MLRLHPILPVITADNGNYVFRLNLRRPFSGARTLHISPCDGSEYSGKHRLVRFPAARLAKRGVKWCGMWGDCGQAVRKRAANVASNLD
jgi:hypothetical protein